MAMDEVPWEFLDWSSEEVPDCELCGRSRRVSIWALFHPLLPGDFQHGMVSRADNCVCTYQSSSS